VANLTGADSALAFAREQVVDSLAVVPHVGAGRLLDVGSGNGLPGIVLAIARPALAVTLLEPRAKRARFLTQVRIELGLANVEVVCARVEDHHPLQAYDTLIARAFAALPDFVAATRHLLRPGTRLLAMKGQLDARELAACGLPLAALKTLTLNVPGYAERHLVMVDAGSATSGFVP
jgi:16S rRNA (guanine527-N7)-methyltransferase